MSDLDLPTYGVVDLETTGLDMREHVICEAAVIIYGPDADGVYDVTDHFAFVPNVAPQSLGFASPEALAVNRWYERRRYLEMLSSVETDRAWRNVADALDGATLVAANPAFDAKFLARELSLRLDLDEMWHYRLLDVQAMTMGAGRQALIMGSALGITGGAEKAAVMRPPSFPECITLWSLDGYVRPGTEHTALGDAAMTLRVLQAALGHPILPAGQEDQW